MKILSKPFYLIRHAQTSANTKSLACGLMDSSLTENGKTQAKKISTVFNDYLKKTPIIYHSSLKRSKETAEYLKGIQEVNLVECPGINEQSFGEWEGIPWISVIEKLKKGEQPPGGESREQYSNRVVKSLNFILSTHSLHYPPLIIAHGGTFFALGYVFGLEVIDIPNCYISYFAPQKKKDELMPWAIYTFDESINNFKEECIYFSLKKK